MTCIVALRTSSGVVMGGDSCAGAIEAAYPALVVKTPKVARVGEFIIGYTTSFRMGQILHHVINVRKPHPEDDVHSHLITALIPDIIAAFKAQGYGATKDGELCGGQFILGHKNRLFVVQSDFSVLEYEQDYIAVGCGASTAMGAMFATKALPKLSAIDRLTTALKAAAAYSGMVKEPFHFIATDK